jgi:hypothetical protein
VWFEGNNESCETANVYQERINCWKYRGSQRLAMLSKLVFSKRQISNLLLEGVHNLIPPRNAACNCGKASLQIAWMLRLESVVISNPRHSTSDVAHRPYSGRTVEVYTNLLEITSLYSIPTFLRRNAETHTYRFNTR